MLYKFSGQFRILGFISGSVSGTVTCADDQAPAWLAGLITQGEKLMATLQELKDQVAQNTSVEESAVLLIGNLADKIQTLIDAGGSPADFQALVDELSASKESLAAAVTANTPVQPPLPPQ
jgi:hypothetical protein